MKISQLATTSGQSISTIKYYIREGLLPHGRSTAQNQATYDDSHLNRLALIGLLKDELNMSAEEMAVAFASLQRPTGRTRAQPSASLRRDGPDDAERSRAVQEILATAKDMGWLLKEGDPIVQQASAHLLAIGRVFPELPPVDFLSTYAQAMNELALQEVDLENSFSDDSWDEESRFVLKTLLFGPLLLAFRQIARRERVAQLEEMNR